MASSSDDRRDDVDPDAIEIGELYRKAREAIGTNAPPLQIGDISTQKYQEAVTGEPYYTPRPMPVTDPNVCHWCRDPFKPPKRKRFVILDECNHSGGWGLVSICFECFKGYSGKRKDDESGINLERVTCECRGCGEPISIPGRRYSGMWRWFHWQVCSRRCYQRDYRKRRRVSGSSVSWKWRGSDRRCAACNKHLDHAPRRDAKFCSNRCRQWHHRRRKATAR